MLMVVLASTLTGAVLGLRFPVYALLLACAVACVMIGTSALAGNDVMVAVWQAGAAVVFLQVGYLAGIAIRFVMAAARSPKSSSPRSARRWSLRQDMPKA